MEFLGQVTHQLTHLIEKFRELSFFSWFSTFGIAFLGWYGDIIGFQNQAVRFIIILVILDFVTRFLAQFIKASKESNIGQCIFLVYVIKVFTFALEKKLISSRKFWVGWFTKIISYSVVFIIAQQASITESIPFQDYIVNTLYCVLIISDIISICENASEYFEPAQLLLKVFKRKAKELEGQDTPIPSSPPVTEDEENSTTLVTKDKY